MYFYSYFTPPGCLLSSNYRVEKTDKEQMEDRWKIEVSLIIDI